jgi:hypothetical protein
MTLTAQIARILLFDGACEKEAMPICQPVAAYGMAPAGPLLISFQAPRNRWTAAICPEQYRFGLAGRFATFS